MYLKHMSAAVFVPLRVRTAQHFRRLLFCRTMASGGDSDRPVTRGMVIDVEKEKFLRMPLAEKRAQYACRGDYVTLDKIPTVRDDLIKERKAQSDEQKEEQLNISELASKVSWWKGDITRLEIDGIVNAANERLQGGGGVDGSIHRASGPSLKQECGCLGGCATGEAKITGAYRLPCKYVIHTVGPRDQSKQKLQECYQNSLKLALENNIRSLAFPCISTGIFGYPNDEAAAVAIGTVKTYLEKHGEMFERVIFCVFVEDDVKLYKNLLPQKFQMP